MVLLGVRRKERGERSREIVAEDGGSDENAGRELTDDSWEPQLAHELGTQARNGEECAQLEQHQQNGVTGQGFESLVHRPRTIMRALAASARS